MRIIYEDGNERFDIDDISSGRQDLPSPIIPRDQAKKSEPKFDSVSEFNSSQNMAQPQSGRPSRVPPKPPMPEIQTANLKKEEPEQPSQPLPAQYTQGFYPPVYQAYPPQVFSSQQPMPQYPVQNTAYPNQPLMQNPVYPNQQNPVYPNQQNPVYPNQQNQQPNPYPAQPVYYSPYPANAYPQQNPPYPQNPVQDNDAGNAGTRVLYQSPDFDAKEKTYESSYKAPYSFKPHQTQIRISDEPLPQSKEKKVPQADFTVDDMELSTLQLDSIPVKNNMSSRKVKSPNDSAFDVEEVSDIEENYNEDQSYASDESEAEEKKTPPSEIIRKSVLIISILAIVVSSVMLINEYRLSKENENLMSDLSNLIIEEPSSTTAAPETTKKEDTEKPSKPKPSKKPSQPSTTAPPTPQQQWDQIKQEYPDVIFPPDLQLKYARLYAANQDFVGYLSADGVNLNLPIVQAENDDIYLKKNFYGESTKYGCPFVTHINSIDPLDTNTIIFGHHMNDGSVFGALDKYKSIEGFRKAPVITFNTINNNYSWKVIAAFITNAYEKDDNGYVFKYYFSHLSTQDRYSAYLNELAQRSLYDTGVDVLPTDKILTLSTCSHEFQDARFVVVARLMRPGETSNVDISKAAENPSPRYPQAYYDKKGQKNPYADAYRWEVG